MADRGNTDRVKSALGGNLRKCSFSVVSVYFVVTGLRLDFLDDKAVTALVSPESLLRSSPITVSRLDLPRMSLLQIQCICFSMLTCFSLTTMLWD